MRNVVDTIYLSTAAVLYVFINPAATTRRGTFAAEITVNGIVQIKRQFRHLCIFNRPPRCLRLAPNNTLHILKNRTQSTSLFSHPEFRARGDENIVIRNAVGNTR